MPAANAIKRALEDGGGVISSALIPDLSKLTQGSSQYWDGVRKLSKWLKQQGLSDAEIANFTPLKWNDMKVNRFDWGAGLKDSVLAKVPKNLKGWGKLAASYLVPGGTQGAQLLENAWNSFADNMTFGDKPTESLSWIKRGNQRLNKVFDKFLKSYADEQRGYEMPTGWQRDDPALAFDLLDQVRKGTADHTEIRTYLKGGFGRMSSGAKSQHLLEMFRENPSDHALGSRIDEYLERSVEDMQPGRYRSAKYTEQLLRDPTNVALRHRVDNYLDLVLNGDEEDLIAWDRMQASWEEGQQNVRDFFHDNRSLAKQGNEALVRKFQGIPEGQSMDDYFGRVGDSSKRFDEFYKIWDEERLTAPPLGYLPHEVFSKEQMELWGGLRRMSDADQSALAVLQGVRNDPSKFDENVEKWVHDNQDPAERLLAARPDIEQDFIDDYPDWVRERGLPSGARTVNPLRDPKDFAKTTWAVENDVSKNPMVWSERQIEQFEKWEGRIRVPKSFKGKHRDFFSDVDTQIKNSMETVPEANVLLDRALLGEENYAFLTEVNDYIDTLEPVDPELSEWVNAWNEERTPEMPAGRPRTTTMERPLVREVESFMPESFLPEETRFLDVDVSEVEGLPGEVETLKLYNVPKEITNSEEALAVLKSAGEDGTLGKYMSYFGSKAFAINMGKMALSGGIGAAIQSTLHNDNEWTIFNAALGTAGMGWTGAIGGILQTWAQEYGADWQIRRHAYYHHPDRLDKVAYLRTEKSTPDGKPIWVPIIIVSDPQPVRAATFLNMEGRDQNWKGAVDLHWESGVGLRIKEDGHLGWIQPGKKGKTMMRKTDYTWGTTFDDATGWKPWNNIWIPSDEKQTELIKYGMPEPIIGKSNEEIFEKLGSGEKFKALIEVIHMMHFNDIGDPRYAGKLVDKDPDGKIHPHWEGDWDGWMESMGRTDVDHWGGNRSFWYNMGGAASLGWTLETQNPDNWAQSQTDVETYPLYYWLSDFGDMLEKQYAALTPEERRELGETILKPVGKTAADVQARLRLINQGDLSDNVKKYRIAQEQTRFIYRTGSTVYRDEDVYEGTHYSKFAAAANKKIYAKFQESDRYYADLHPLDAIKAGQDDWYGLMYGDAGHQSAGWYNRNILGIKEVPQITPHANVSKHNPMIDHQSESVDHMGIRAMMKSEDLSYLVDEHHDLHSFQMNYTWLGKGMKLDEIRMGEHRWKEMTMPAYHDAPDKPATGAAKTEDTPAPSGA